MEFDTDGETLGVRTQPSDLELVRAARDTIYGVRDLADAAGLNVFNGKCEGCGTTGKVLRGFPLQDDDSGEFFTSRVCRECQSEFVKRIQHSASKGERDAAD